MDINKLTTIANNIRAVDTTARLAKFDSIRDYGIRQHNAMVDILKEVYQFVENNLDIFEPKGITWSEKSRNKLYYTNHQIGSTNKYNCVIRDIESERYHEGERIYWVDGGIIFRIRTSDNRVCRLTDCRTPKLHGYEGDTSYWNDSYDFTEFNYPLGSYANNDPLRYGINTINWEDMYWTKDTFPIQLSEFNVEKFKKNVDEDLVHAEKVVERLTFTLNEINKSVNNRLTTIDKVLDESKPKSVCKYVVEITKCDNFS